MISQEQIIIDVVRRVPVTSEPTFASFEELRLLALELERLLENRILKDHSDTYSPYTGKCYKCGNYHSISSAHYL